MISKSVSFIGVFLTTAVYEVRGFFDRKINVGILSVSRLFRGGAYLPVAFVNLKTR
jgi:hypothetical protein